MKRSQINTVLEEADVFLRSHGFALPPFAHLPPEAMHAPDYAEIRARQLGWDLTDFDSGDFARKGLVLFTLRNGTLPELAAGAGMVYCEKVIVLRDGQHCPMHRHFRKTEDIINRAGGALVLELFASDPDGARDLSAPVEVICDGIARQLPAGGLLRLASGESVTLRPGDWHAFWAEGADCLVGEVSTVNDDVHDNRFDPELPRFSDVIEDATPWRLLVSDYPEAAR